MKTLRGSELGVERDIGAVEEEACGPRAGVRIGYLLSRYPAISHTFLLQEVLGLRARGFQIETASINLPDRSWHELAPREASEASQTYYVQGRSRRSAAWALFCVSLWAPGAVFRGIRAVFKIRGLTVPARVYWLFYLAEALLLGRWMRKRDLQHLHVHFGGPVASVGLLVSAAWGIPFSLTIHGPEELLDSTANHLREKVERASFVICISDFCRSQLCQWVSQDCWGKFQVLRLGVDAALLPAREPACGKRDESLQAVCIGRLVPAKGHRTLLEALILLREQAIAMRLILIGGGSEMQRLQDFVKAHQLSECVTFMQALVHEEALAHLRRADLFVLASFAEGIPVALMEAMAMGIPCVSTFVAGIPELIRDGVEGMLVPPGNAHALAEALSVLARDKPRRSAMGKAARARIAEQYDLPSNHERLAHTLEQLLKISHRRSTAEAGT